MTSLFFTVSLMRLLFCPDFCQESTNAVKFTVTPDRVPKVCNIWTALLESDPVCWRTDEVDNTGDALF